MKEEGDENRFQGILFASLLFASGGWEEEEEEEEEEERSTLNGPSSKRRRDALAHDRRITLIPSQSPVGQSHPRPSPPTISALSKRQAGWRGMEGRTNVQRIRNADFSPRVERRTKNVDPPFVKAIKWREDKCSERMGEALF